MQGAVAKSALVTFAKLHIPEWVEANKTAPKNLLYWKSLLHRLDSKLGVRRKETVFRIFRESRGVSFGESLYRRNCRDFGMREAKNYRPVKVIPTIAAYYTSHQPMPPGVPPPPPNHLVYALGRLSDSPDKVRYLIFSDQFKFVEWLSMPGHEPNSPYLRIVLQNGIGDRITRSYGDLFWATSDYHHSGYIPQHHPVPTSGVSHNPFTQNLPIGGAQANANLNVVEELFGGDIHPNSIPQPAPPEPQPLELPPPPTWHFQYTPTVSAPTPQGGNHHFFSAADYFVPEQDDGNLSDIPGGPDSA